MTELGEERQGHPSKLQTWAPRVATLLMGLGLGLWLGGSETPVEPTTGADGEAGTRAEAPAQEVWTCSMHPQIQQPEPGQCPICGMDLIPLEPQAGGGEAAADQVVLSERAKTLAKLRTQAVERRHAATTDLHLLGRIEPNEESLRTVTAWTGGRIERLYVNTTGEKVKSGQSIASLYSPEIYAAHQDLIVAKRQVSRLANSPQSARLAAEAALEATRDRLRLLGVPENELKRLEKEPRPRRSVRIRSPYSGTVIERIASEGAYLTTGAPLYRIAKLDSLWVQLDAYESDLSRLLVGQSVEVSVEAIPDESFAGEVTFIDPTLDPRRRTVRVRVEVDNSHGRLRPGMFAEAVLKAETEARTPLVIPATAPLFTGRRALVFVEVGDADGRTTYEPRSVRLGPRAGDVYPVVAGLSEGDRVVVRGAFALDADLQIRGGRSMMSSPDDREPGQWDAIIEVSAEERAQFAPVVAAYLGLQRALAADDLAAAQRAGKTLGTATRDLEFEGSREALLAWKQIAAELAPHAEHLEHAKDLEGARGAFEAITAQVETLLERVGNPTDETLHRAFCPMAMGSKGATWIQAGGQVDNAYFGAAMRSCGELEQSVAPGSHLHSSADAASPPAAAGGHVH